MYNTKAQRELIQARIAAISELTPLEKINMLMSGLVHTETVWSLGPEKPVATYDSGSGIQYQWHLWNSLDAREEEFITKLVFKNYHEQSIELSVKRVDESDLGVGNIANVVVFYSKQHLQMFADVCGKTMDDLFDIICHKEFDDEEKIDIIKILFNNNYDDDVTTPAGRKWKEQYLQNIGEDAMEKYKERRLTSHVEKPPKSAIAFDIEMEFEKFMSEPSEKKLRSAGGRKRKNKRRSKVCRQRRSKKRKIVTRKR